MTSAPRSVDPVASLRSPALALALTPPVLLVCALLAPADARVSALVVPSALAGLLAPVLAYRFYHRRLERLADDTTRDRGAAEFRLATLVSLSITALAALVGVAGFWLSGDAITLIGVAMHAVLSGAVWPTPERLEGFTRGGGPQ